MAIYTAFCQEAGGSGTIWIDAVAASSAEEAADIAQGKCAFDWDCDEADVHVLGVIEGNVKVLYWQDQGA